MFYKYLSYPLAKNIQGYGGNKSTSICPVKSIINGDSSNVFEITFQNHTGTHIDAPGHFFDNGDKIIDYEADFWFFKAPQVIKIALNKSELLTKGAWTEEIKKDSDVLIICSGWSKFRNETFYGLENPGIHPEVGFFLRENFPDIKAIGFDMVSISSFQKREIGREAHKAFLDPSGLNHPILIIEDMDLSYDSNYLSKLYVFPMLIEAIDSSPCTIIGEFEE